MLQSETELDGLFDQRVIHNPVLNAECARALHIDNERTLLWGIYRDVGGLLAVSQNAVGDTYCFIALLVSGVFHRGKDALPYKMPFVGDVGFFDVGEVPAPDLELLHGFTLRGAQGVVIEHEKSIDATLKLERSALPDLEFVGHHHVHELQRQLASTRPAQELLGFGSARRRIVRKHCEGFDFRKNRLQRHQSLAQVSGLVDSGNVAAGTLHGFQQPVLHGGAVDTPENNGNFRVQVMASDVVGRIVIAQEDDVGIELVDLLDDSRDRVGDLGEPIAPLRVHPELSQHDFRALNAIVFPIGFTLLGAVQVAHVQQCRGHAVVGVLGPQVLPVIAADDDDSGFGAIVAGRGR